MLLIGLIVSIALLMAIWIYKMLKERLDYWKKKGVPFVKPVLFFGNYLPVATLKKNSNEIYRQAYSDFPDEPMVGVYEFTNPTLVLRDPEVIEKVLIRDFNSFPDHGHFIFEPSSAMYEGIFMLGGERWRAIRNKLVTTFTTGRMREMYSGMVECCDELLKSEPETLDRESMSRFSVDAFLRSLFGTRVNPEGDFELRNNIKEMFTGHLTRYLQQQFLAYYPKTANALGAKFMPNHMDTYFRSLLFAMLKGRLQSGGHRRDFADLLIQMIKEGKMNIYDRENSRTENVFELTENLVISQGFMFFFAGMDTTSLAMLYTGYELAANRDAQEKARDEVRRVLQKHGGFTYDSIRELKYMEQCIQESLRIHPTLTFLMRIAVRDTYLNGIKVEKGVRVIIPNLALQMDSNYFPDPERFDPERFSPDSSEQRNRFTHLPFSDGPRVCLGKKFSFVEISTLFAHLLNKYELSVDPQTVLPIEYEGRTNFLTPKTPVVIKLTKLNY